MEVMDENESEENPVPLGLSAQSYKLMRMQP